MNARPTARRRALLPVLAALLAGMAQPAAAQYTEPVLGRLFTAPDERTRLDRDRANALVVAATPAEPAMPVAAPASQPAPPPPAPLHFSGVVRRSDGRATVFIGDEARSSVLGRYRPGAPIAIDTPAGRVLARPGQSIDPNNGAARDAR